MRSVIVAAICVLAFGLIIPTSSRSADISVDQRTPPDLAAATTRTGDVGKSAADDPSYLLTPFKLASQPNLKQSVFGFAGRTDSGNLWSTFAYGIGAPEAIFYDNYIVGGAYQRDFFQFNSGILIGAEVGLADRFGHYRICCDTIAYSSGVTHSAELWGGVSLRHEGIALFDTVRISPGFVFGLSAISSPIGQEGLHQIDHQGSAKVLFYLGFDLAFALANLTQHRTGFPHSAPLRRLWNARCYEGGQQRQCHRDTAKVLKPL